MQNKVCSKVCLSLTRTDKPPHFLGHLYFLGLLHFWSYLQFCPSSFTRLSSKIVNFCNTENYYTKKWARVLPEAFWCHQM